MAKLVINPGTSQAREFDLKPGPNFVGRGFANDITIEDSSISTSHCQILVDGDSVTVKDLGSTNGTFLNREPITEAALSSGQLLRLGGVELAFENTASAYAPIEAEPTSFVSPLPPIGSASIPETVLPPSLPPLPTPVTARLRVATSGSGPTAVLAAPPGLELPPPPIATANPPAVPGMMELPEEKSACKFHKKNPAQWFCQKCHQAFCSLCVSTRRSPEGTGYFCRTCGVECAPVKVKYTATKQKGSEVYSDVTVLLRSIGFGFGAALLAGILWAASAKAMGLVFLMLPPFFCWGTGALCGYAVKVACQDRPGIVFSLIACGFCVLGIFCGEVGAAIALYPMRIGIGVYTLFGFLGGLFTAWRIGGGDF